MREALPVAPPDRVVAVVRGLRLRSLALAAADPRLHSYCPFGANGLPRRVGERTRCPLPRRGTSRVAGGKRRRVSAERSPRFRAGTRSGRASGRTRTSGATACAAGHISRARPGAAPSLASARFGLTPGYATIAPSGQTVPGGCAGAPRARCGCPRLRSVCPVGALHSERVHEIQ